MPVMHRGVQWGNALVVGCVRIAAGLKQELDHVKVAARAGHMEWSLACIILGAQIGLCLDQIFGNRQEIFWARVGIWHLHTVFLGVSSP